MRSMLWLSLIGLATVCPLSRPRNVDCGLHSKGTLTSSPPWLSADGRILASGGGGNDKTIMLWDVADGKNTSTLKGHDAPALRGL